MQNTIKGLLLAVCLVSSAIHAAEAAETNHRPVAAQPKDPIYQWTAFAGQIAATTLVHNIGNELRQQSINDFPANLFCLGLQVLVARCAKQIVSEIFQLNPKVDSFAAENNNANLWGFLLSGTNKGYAWPRYTRAVTIEGYSWPCYTGVVTIEGYSLPR